MKLIQPLLSAAILALVGATITNMSDIQLNAKEIVHEREMRELMIRNLTDSINKQNAHLENIESFLRDYTRDKKLH